MKGTGSGNRGEVRLLRGSSPVSGRSIRRLQLRFLLTARTITQSPLEGLQGQFTAASDRRGGFSGNHTYTSRWGQEYTIGAMLEHAVMHPMRHAFHLDELMERGRQAPPLSVS
jgi:hypothetical protein